MRAISMISFLLALVLAASCGREQAVQDSGIPEIGSGSEEISSGPPSTTGADEIRPDPIVKIIEQAIVDLVSGKRGFEEDWSRIQNDLLEAAVDEDLGDERILVVSARAVTELIIEQGMNRSDEGPTTLDASQRAAAASLARTLAVSFRESVKLGGVHRGILTRTPEFDVPDGYVKVQWKTVSGFEYVDRMELPGPVAELDEKRVGMAGFMMSMGEFEDVRNFLLVESQWSCCFGQPPDVNQVVICQIPLEHASTEMTSVPVRVLGTLEVGEEREDGYVISLYRMVVDRVDPLE